MLVKAGATAGDVVPNPKEWSKAKRFKEREWLYVLKMRPEPMHYQHSCLEVKGYRDGRVREVYRSCA